MRSKHIVYQVLDFLNVSRWVPVTTAWCLPWVADRVVGLQIWRLAANILNKQSWATDQEWSSSLGVWLEANNLTL